MGEPLEGRAVLVTRAANQAADLIALLTVAGAEAIALPTLGFFPPVNPARLAKAQAEVSKYAWIAFTSANAVHAFFEGVDDPAKRLTEVRLAVLGPRTAEALTTWGFSADMVAAKGNARSLAEGLGKLVSAGELLLYPRPERVAEDLAGLLRSRGLRVDDPIAYRTAPPAGDTFAVSERLNEGTLHWITLLSGSALRHLWLMLPEPELIARARLATIGPSTSAEARHLGLAVHAEAASPSSEALVEAIVAAESPS